MESSCDSGCVAVSDFLEEGKETLQFMAREGVVYYVAVTGEGFEDSGKFDIAMTLPRTLYPWIVKKLMLTCNRSKERDHSYFNHCIPLI